MTLKNILSEDRVLRLAKALIMLIALAVFLPFQVTASIVAAVGVLFCLLPNIRARIFSFKSTRIWFAFLCFATSTAVYRQNYVGMRRTLVFMALLGVCSVTRSIADKGFFEKLLNVFVLGGSLASVQGIVEYLLNLNAEGYRSVAFYTNPNFYGTALTFVILICGYKASTHAKHTWVYYAAAVLNAVALYFSGSLSLWLVAIIGILIMLILHSEYKLLIIFSSLVVAAVVVLFAVPNLVHRLDELTATIDNRVKIWSFALENFKESPFIGHGFYSYKFLYSQLPTPNDVYPASMSHSVYLDSLLCHGIVGVCLLFTALASYFVSLFSCRRKLKAQGKASPITGFVIAISIALALYGLMDTTFVWIQTGGIVALIASGLGVEEK